jgi:hypothetical protein
LTNVHQIIASKEQLLYQYDPYPLADALDVLYSVIYEFANALPYENTGGGGFEYLEAANNAGTLGGGGGGGDGNGNAGIGVKNTANTCEVVASTVGEGNGGGGPGNIGPGNSMATFSGGSSGPGGVKRRRDEWDAILGEIKLLMRQVKSSTMVTPPVLQLQPVLLYGDQRNGKTV